VISFTIGDLRFTNRSSFHIHLVNYKAGILSRFFQFLFLIREIRVIRG